MQTTMLFSKRRLMSNCQSPLLFDPRARRMRSTEKINRVRSSWRDCLFAVLLSYRFSSRRTATSKRRIRPARRFFSVVVSPGVSSTGNNSQWLPLLWGVCVCVCACVRACVRVWVGGWVGRWVGGWVCACMRACVRACVRARVCVYAS